VENALTRNSLGQFRADAKIEFLKAIQLQKAGDLEGAQRAASVANRRQTALDTADGLSRKALERKTEILAVIVPFLRAGDPKGKKQADAIASKAAGVWDRNQLSKKLRGMTCDILATSQGADLATELLAEGEALL